MPFGLGFGELIISLLIMVVMVLPVWRVLAKAGYSGAWSLLMFVPFVNFAALYVFAFLEWPLERRAAAAPRPPA